MKRTLKPIFPPAGIEREYEKRLKKTVREMEKSCVYWLRAKYRANESRIVGDSATDDLLKAFRKLLHQWERNFRELADVLPRWFVTKIRGYVTGNLAQQTKPLKDAGLGFNLKFSYMSQRERQTFQAIVKENVNLIKSIARESLTQVEGIVLRNIEAGHDLARMTEELHHQFGVSERRARMIARDQTNKATNNLTRQRLLSYGITKGIWMHTASGKTYRETHELDHTQGGMNGAEYFIDEGCYDPNPNVQDYIQPGELVNCYCVCRPLVPTLSEEETEQGIEEILKEVEGNGIMSSKEDALSMVHSEAAVIPVKGETNAFTVNYDLINSKAYHDKFIGMTGNKIVDEAMYKKSIEFLTHRNGTKFEDIAMLSVRTGKVLEENTEWDIEFKTGLPEDKALRLIAKGQRFEIIHNHPGSTPPSISDINKLFERELADASTIPAHDGKIYRMIKLKQHDNIADRTQDIYEQYRDTHLGLPKDMIERRAADLILSLLEKEGYLEYWER